MEAKDSHETTDALMSLVPYEKIGVKKYFCPYVFILNAKPVFQGRIARRSDPIAEYRH
jgi:hypothetical protein